MSSINGVIQMFSIQDRADYNIDILNTLKRRNLIKPVTNMTTLEDRVGTLSLAAAALETRDGHAGRHHLNGLLGILKAGSPLSERDGSEIILPYMRQALPGNNNPQRVQHADSGTMAYPQLFFAIYQAVRTPPSMPV